MFRQLGGVTREGTRKIAGYLSVLKAWVYDHFRLWGNAKQSWDARLPTIAKWEPPHFIGVLDEQIITLRELLDDLSPEEVLWDPYVESKIDTPLHAITWFTRCLLCLDIEEPYHPDRVMRQMGNVQVIPVYPIQAKRKNRVQSGKHYFVQYEVLVSFARRWHYSVVPPNQQGADVKLPWDSVMDYLNWFHRISHPFVQPPNRRRNFSLRRHLFISNKREIAIGHARDLINASIEEGANVNKLILLSRQNKIRDLVDEMSTSVTVEQAEEEPDVRTSADSRKVGGGGSERRTKSRHEQRFYARKR